jgi:ABC-type glycerol-3-phosphate transport system substrate-binding protein
VAQTLGIPANAKHKELATEFLRILGDQAGEEVLLKYNFIPSWPVKDIPPGASELLRHYLTQQEIVYPGGRFFTANPQTYTALLDGMQKLLEGHTDAASVTDGILNAPDAR